MDSAKTLHEGQELRKDDFDVQIILTEKRAKEKTKIKHKLKTMLIDKGDYWPCIFQFSQYSHVYIFGQLFIICHQ